jgi:hypothetical protein
VGLKSERSLRFCNNGLMVGWVRFVNPSKTGLIIDGGFKELIEKGIDD